jgi:hypothetical protein
LKKYSGIERTIGKSIDDTGEGDYDGAKELMDKYAVDSPSMEALRNKLAVLPVDINRCLR